MGGERGIGRSSGAEIDGCYGWWPSGGAAPARVARRGGSVRGCCWLPLWLHRLGRRCWRPAQFRLHPGRRHGSVPPCEGMPRQSADRRCGCALQARLCRGPCAAPSRATYLTGQYPPHTTGADRTGRRPAATAGSAKAAARRRRSPPGSQGAGYAPGGSASISDQLPRQHARTLTCRRAGTTGRCRCSAARSTRQYNYTLNVDRRLEVVRQRAGRLRHRCLCPARRSTSSAAPSERDQPFYALLWAVAPHAPYVAAPRHAGLFVEAKVPAHLHSPRRTGRTSRPSCRAAQ